MTTKYCKRCCTNKPATEEFFYLVRPRKYPAYLQSICRECCNKASKKWQKANPDQVKSSYMQRFKRDPEKIRKQKSSSQVLKHRKIKAAVLAHYGGNPPVCDCCAEPRFEFLCLDHVGGGGAQHRKTFKGSIYFWIVKANYPEGFRVLCHNCNMAISFYGYCPHRPPDSTYTCGS